MKIKNTKLDVNKITLCIILALITLIGGYFLNNLKQDDPIWQKVLINLLPPLSLGLLVNILTNMFNTDTKRKKLAEDLYNNLYPIANNLLVKSQREPLTLQEYEIFCNLTKTMGNFGKYCDIDLNQIHNVYQRFIQNPPPYPESNTNPYGVLQTYNTWLINHNHAPTIADSGSLAIPPIRN